MQYHILGGDGKQYGPIDIETLRRWADEGRVMPDTEVRDAANGLVCAASEILQANSGLATTALPTKPCPNCGFRCEIDRTHCPNCGAFLGMLQAPPAVQNNEAAERKILGLSVGACVIGCIIAALIGAAMVAVIGVVIFHGFNDALKNCSNH